MGDSPDHAQAAVAAEQNRAGPRLHRCRSPSRRNRMPMSDEERKLRSGRVRGMVSLPFLLLPRTPSSSLPSLPCADAQGWNSTLLDNARKFRMKFTVADPVGICHNNSALYHIPRRMLRAIFSYHLLFALIQGFRPTVSPLAFICNFKKMLPSSSTDMSRNSRRPPS